MKLPGIYLASNSYCRATCTAYLAKVTEPSVATSGFTPEMPAMRKYVFVRSNFVEKARADTEEAAFISVAREFSKPLHSHDLQLTTLANGDLTDVPFCSAMSIGIYWRETRHSDVARKKIKFWNAVPHRSFWIELKHLSDVYTEREVLTLYHANDEDFGLDFLMRPG